MNIEDKIFIQVQCSKADRERLKDIAANQDRSMSAVVRQWINKEHEQLAKAGKV